MWIGLVNIGEQNRIHAARILPAVFLWRHAVAGVDRSLKAFRKCFEFGCLFNNVVIIFAYVVSKLGWLGNDESGKIWKETIVAYSMNFPAIY